MNNLHRVRLSFLFLGGVLLAFGACNPPGGKKTVDVVAHGHDEDGPHGGAIAEGPDEKYHGEFLVDHDKKQTTVYILDHKAKNLKAIKAEGVYVNITNVTPLLKIDLKAEPQPGDSPGMSSKFVGTHDKLAVEMEYKGEIVGMAGDKQYTWKFEEKPHSDEKAKK